MSYLQDKSPKAIADAIKVKHRNFKSWLFALWKNAGEEIWNNPDATPQQLLAEFGPDAGEMFDMSESIGQMHYKITGQPYTPVPPGYEYERDEDGNVRITKEPPAPEPEPEIPEPEEESNESSPETES